MPICLGKISRYANERSFPGRRRVLPQEVENRGDINEQYNKDWDYWRLYAQNQLGMTEAQHEEVNPEASQLVISLLSCSLVGETCTIFINKSSKTFQFYQKGEAKERYTCSFGLNPKFQQMIDESGFKVVGTDETGQARILELSQNKFFIATLFQPQLSSEPENPHSLIVAFLTYAREFHCA